MWELIDNARKERNLTVGEFVSGIGISRGNYSDWKRGKCLPSFTVMAKISKLLGISLDYFADGIM